MSRNAQDWYTSTNPDELLGAARSLEEATSPSRARRRAERDARRRRLFGCACARMVWDLLPTDARSAVAISERYADDRATDDDLRAATIRLNYGSVTPQQHALAAAGWASSAVYGREEHLETVRPTYRPTDAARNAAKALAARAAGSAPPGSPTTAAWEAAWNTAYAATRAHQAELVRDIFPPPGPAPALNSDWRTSTAVALARQMDETGEFSAVPILADALQDAGCDNDLVLDRCRAPSGIHCRGNWVVDLVLGRE